MVELRKITQDNFVECTKLKVAENQEGFVATCLYSMAQAWLYHPNAFPFAIYADDIMVGFLMLGYVESKGIYDVWRLLIDAQHQGKGYGKKALLLAIQHLVDTFGAKEVYLSFVPDNTIAGNLYRSVGFEPTGEMAGNEVVMCLKVDTEKSSTI